MANHTRKNKIICYDGRGAHKSGVHTPKNFMKIKEIRQPRKSCTNPDRRKEIPHYCNGITIGSVNEMVRWSGAIWSTRKKCRTMMQVAKRADEEYERLLKIPGTKEHQILLDNLKMAYQNLSVKDKSISLRKYKKYLTKNEIQSLLA